MSKRNNYNNSQAQQWDLRGRSKWLQNWEQRLLPYLFFISFSKGKLWGQECLCLRKAFIFREPKDSRLRAQGKEQDGADI